MIDFMAVSERALSSVHNLSDRFSKVVKTCVAIASLRYLHIFSAGFNSGQYGGINSSAMLSGTFK